MADGEISFGRFRRELRRGNEPVQLGGRALDILLRIGLGRGRGRQQRRTDGTP
jgi:hypothetical protein